MTEARHTVGGAVPAVTATVHARCSLNRMVVGMDCCVFSLSADIGCGEADLQYDQGPGMRESTPDDPQQVAE